MEDVLAESIAASDHARENVQVERLDKSRFPSFHGNGAHYGVVGAKPHRGNVQFDLPTVGFFVQALAE